MQIADARPIWIQLVDDFRQRIVSGQWPTSSRIPSVRELAAGTGVNPNTVQRALSELDRMGLTSAERTAGRYVTSDAAALDAARRELAAKATDTYITAVSQLGMDLSQAVQALEQRWPTADPTTTGEPS
ncbi:GntR family transcriptional regulator [Actinomyces trachealis]|uniref:GntR family transcriptional regulator n=1 Tax=Actinomyces trachealis TaxID=2763540 RepID=UPI0018928D72|nr:GntR family transcriptional regulator [Actinomyces trachealis]